jgi:hypothetical protein
MFEIFGYAIFVIEKREEHFMETKCFFFKSTIFSYEWRFIEQQYITDITYRLLFFLFYTFVEITDPFENNMI